MMDDRIRRILSQKDMHPLHQELLSFCNRLLKPSRERQSGNYAQWDEAHLTYMRKRRTDKDDKEALLQGLPAKTTVPMGFSQVTTGVAFGYMLFTQKARFYEFNGVDDADKGMRECGERLVERDLLSTNYKTRLFQTLLDLFRFGMCVEKDWYEDDYVYMPITMQIPGPLGQDGQPTGPAMAVTDVQKVLRRQGNCIRYVSPYRVFTDASFHPTDWRNGSFVATDDEWTRFALKSMELNGVVVGVDEIPKYSRDNFISTGRWAASRIAGLSVDAPEKYDGVVLTEMVVTIVPSQIKADGSALGDSDMPHKWIVWIANDSRVIRAEPYTAYHGQWPVSIGFFLPDQHSATLNSLSWIINDLQGMISWFMNSRMAAVSRMIDGQVIVDPLGVNTADISSRQRIIRLNKAAAMKDVRRFVTQVDHKDTTQGHVGDMSNLIQMIQLITGVNDNAMGQYNGGRRSATEARSVMTGASSRLKIIFDVLWDSFYQPQSNRLLSNHRQGISVSEFQNVCGVEKTQQYFDAFKATPQDLIRAYDFTTYDGTLPSEKLFLAQQLQELLTLLITNPTSSVAFNMDPNKVQKQIMELRGLGRGADLAYDPAILQQITTALQQQAAAQSEQQPSDQPPSQ